MRFIPCWFLHFVVYKSVIIEIIFFKNYYKVRNPILSPRASRGVPGGHLKPSLVKFVRKISKNMEQLLAFALKKQVLFSECILEPCVYVPKVPTCFFILTEKL